MSNAQTVQEIYAAFGTGDIETILGHLAPDCAWEQWADNQAQNQGVVNMQPRTGPEGALEFFQIVGAQFQVNDFQVLDVIGDGRQVAAEIEIELVNPSGNTIRDEELHLWTFSDDGKVTRVRHYIDTAKHIAARG
jgi:ketosteroid isomerase-like protein